jgi:hypothetical protein
MSVASINEPGMSRKITLTPQSLNEPIGIDDLNPPKITGTDPTSCAVGDPALTLTVTGDNFANGMSITFGGSPIVTTFVSDTELSGALDPVGLTAADYPVTVVAGAYEAYPAVMFTVTAAAAPEEDKFVPTHGPRARR